MSQRDLIGLVASYIYAGGLLAVGEALRRLFNVSANLTRKVVHIGAGMWVLGVLALFDTWWWGIVPFATFILLNYVIYRYKLVKALDDDSASPGTVYFAIAVTLVFGLLWRPAGPVDRAPVALAAVMAMTWGDALAALLGRAYGRRRYTISGAQRSYLGSAVMFAVSALAIFASLWLLPGSALAPLAEQQPLGRVLFGATLGAAVATAAEASAPHGFDNLAVPVLTALTLWVMGF